MKISNFEIINKETRMPAGAYKATVDVETGILWKKKVVNREVQRKVGEYWFFVDTGRFCPDLQVENLARSYTARTGIPT